MCMVECLGKKTEDLVLERAYQLKLVLKRDGFSLKTVTFRKRDLSNNSSADDCSFNLAGMKWFLN